MNFHESAQQTIENMEAQKEKLKEEIQRINKEIEKLKQHPEYAISIEQIIKEIKTIPEFARSSNLKASLSFLILGYGTEKKVKNLFELSQMTEKELLKRYGFGKKTVAGVKKLLQMYGLTLKE